MSYGELSNALVGGAVPMAIVADDLAPGLEAGYAQGPERTLMAAILFDGLQAYISYMCAKGRDARTKYKEAFNWVNSKDNEYVFSFVSVCEGLGIDPQFLRAGLENACSVQVADRKRARRHF
jgi:hypothetical protein